MSFRFASNFVLVASIVSIATSSAHAQSEPVGLIMDTHDQAKARGQLYQMADCLRKRGPAQVEDLLAYNLPQASRVAAMLYSGSGKKCVSATGGLKTDVLIGSLFRSAYLVQANLQQPASSDLASKAALYPSENGGKKLVESMLVADCVVSRNPQGGRALLAAAPGKPEERISFEALQPDASACIAELKQQQIGETLFITALAQVLYRRSRGESFDPNAAPSDGNKSQPQVQCEDDRPNVCVVQPATNSGGK